MRESYDIQIDLSASRKMGRYGFAIRKSPLARSGAGMMHGATMHTLLTMSLCSALKMLSRSVIAKMMVAEGRSPDTKTAIVNPRRLRVLVRSSDTVFIAACGAVNKGQTTRAAKTLWAELTKEMTRFTLLFEHVDESKLSAARDFGWKVMPSRTRPDGFPLPTLITI